MRDLVGKDNTCIEKDCKFEIVCGLESINQSTANQIIEGVKMETKHCKYCIHSDKCPIEKMSRSNLKIALKAEKKIKGYCSYYGCTY